jgi:inner membrane protein
MPSPVGHSLAGYIIYRATGQLIGLPRWQLLGLSLLSANLADLDFIPGLLADDPNRYHHGISHSIGFAALWAVACSLWLALAKKAAVRRTLPLFFALYGSHLALDWLSIDTSAPHGAPFLWPLNDAYYIAPFVFWPDIRRANSLGTFLPSLFSQHNLWAVSVECLVLLPVILLMGVLRDPANSIAKPSGHRGRALQPKRGAEGPQHDR